MIDLWIHGYKKIYYIQHDFFKGNKLETTPCLCINIQSLFFTVTCLSVFYCFSKLFVQIHERILNKYAKINNRKILKLIKLI